METSGRVGRRLRNTFRLLALLCIIIIVANNYEILKLITQSTRLVQKRSPTKNVKTVLIWNDVFGSHHLGYGAGRAAFEFCPVSSCELWDKTKDEMFLPVEDHDAVIFHGFSSNPFSPDRTFPGRRKPHQRYIFLLQESPAMQPFYYGLDNFFNWTATYRKDSDLYMPYLNLQDKVDLPNDTRHDSPVWRQPTFDHLSEEFIKSVAKKTRLVAWFVSNPLTRSRRITYVRILSKFITVDIYGRWAQYQCSSTDDSCDTMLDTTYKFYLAFENSLCVDYVTEKFKRALDHDIIPVVYGGADYSAFAPPLSYINVKDFQSPRHLAEYLHYLDRNPREYAKYFWWKKFYTEGSYFWLCDLCKRLNDPKEPTKTYPSMSAWWNYQGVCAGPKELLLHYRRF